MNLSSLTAVLMLASAAGTGSLSATAAPWVPVTPLKAVSPAASPAAAVFSPGLEADPSLAPSAAIQNASAPKAPAKHPIDVWLEECTAKDESTQGQLACLAEAYKKWDAELNRVYRELMQKLPEAARPSLKASQQAWIKHRNEEFNLLTSLYGMFDGTMYGLMQAADQVDFVRKRTLELSSYLDVLNTG
ncbi:MAG: DUF1311 domain-containing protein [Candidatus Aminicenantes bacterium]|nr:DUF1311 domain-containing protein [Candidatus Aminicenantes bacterium]